MGRWYLVFFLWVALWLSFWFSSIFNLKVDLYVILCGILAAFFVDLENSDFTGMNFWWFCMLVFKNSLYSIVNGLVSGWSLLGFYVVFHVALEVSLKLISIVCYSEKLLPMILFRDSFFFRKKIIAYIIAQVDYGVWGVCFWRKWDPLVWSTWSCISQSCFWIELWEEVLFVLLLDRHILLF